jgi:hypothetical protein
MYWIQCQAGEVSYCRKEQSRSIQNNELDNYFWEQIYDTYIKEYGLNKTYKRMLETMRKKALADLEYCITGDRTQLTYSELEESQLKALLNNRGNAMTIEKTLIHLSKWIGYWIQAGNISTKQYFDLLGEFENYNNVNKQKHNGEENK